MPQLSTSAGPGNCLTLHTAVTESLHPGDLLAHMSQLEERDVNEISDKMSLGGLESYPVHKGSEGPRDP